jgi:hypothetical protein
MAEPARGHIPAAELETAHCRRMPLHQGQPYNNPGLECVGTMHLLPKLIKMINLSCDTRLSLLCTCLTPLQTSVAGTPAAPEVLEMTVNVFISQYGREGPDCGHYARRPTAGRAPRGTA